MKRANWLAIEQASLAVWFLPTIQPKWLANCRPLPGFLACCAVTIAFDNNHQETGDKITATTHRYLLAISKPPGISWKQIEGRKFPLGADVTMDGKAVKLSVDSGHAVRVRGRYRQQPEDGLIAYRTIRRFSGRWGPRTDVISTGI